MVTQVTILHTNDVHSRFENWARVETVARRIRAEAGAEAVLRLDAGDHSDRSFALTEATGARANLALLAAAGVDAFTYGNNESLVWPIAHQSALAQSVAFPVFAADLRRAADGSPMPGVRDWAVVEKAGLRIGLFGISRERPTFLAQLGLSHQEPESVAAECVQVLREQGCDLVIFLSHCGFTVDQAIAAAVPGIDVIVGGHSHTVLEQGFTVGDTVIVQAGDYGRFLGRLDLTVEDGRIIRWNAALLPTELEVPDVATLGVLARWEQEAEERLSEVVAHLPVPLGHDPLGESPLAELLARRLLVKFDADLAMVQGGVLLGGLPAGPVTRGDLLRLCPCNLNPTIAELPGAKLLELLALPAESYEVRIKGGGMRGDTPIGRIFGVGLGEIDPNRVYRVATNDYMAFGFKPFEPLHQAALSIDFDVEQLMRDTLTEALTGLAFRPGETVRVAVYDLDGQSKKWWDVTVESVSPGEIVCYVPGGVMVRDHVRGTEWLNKYATRYWFWPGREYNLFRFYRPDGSEVGSYYNVTLPHAARAGEIAYVDLELDVWHEVGEAPKLLDEDELEAAPYPPEVKARVRQVGKEILERLQK